MAGAAIVDAARPTPAVVRNSRRFMGAPPLLGFPLLRNCSCGGAGHCAAQMLSPKNGQRRVRKEPDAAGRISSATIDWTRGDVHPRRSISRGSPRAVAGPPRSGAGAVAYEVGVVGQLGDLPP